MQLRNFGKNVAFAPEHVYAPKSEAEVLEILSQHRGQQIRVVGRLHSWSEATVGEAIVLDLRNMDEVRVEQRGQEWWAIMAGGAQLKHIVAELEGKHGLTLPSLGLITEQTIAGAAATGTHGSGKHSLSHYVDEVRIATYDPATGEPVIRCLREGGELRAARCGLGCLGVVVSLAMRVRPQYRLEQHFRMTSQIAQVLAAETEFPQQQFYLLPYRWDYLVQHRRETQRQQRWAAYGHRIYWFVNVDLALHILLIGLRRWLRSPALVRLFFRYLVPMAVIRGWKVSDKSQCLLTMEHELFRHIEVEVFVLRQHLEDALGFVIQLLKYLAGERTAIDQATWNELATLGLKERVEACQRYAHHYPICVRKVLADDTLISMASSRGEAYYAISFISYDRPNERTSFFAFAELLVATTTRLFDARPHWGKYCPLEAELIQRLYPELEEFRAICEHVDPQHAFRNAWARRLIWNQPQAT